MNFQKCPESLFGKVGERRTYKVFLKKKEEEMT
jgi:hypothetical protein